MRMRRKVSFLCKVAVFIGFVFCVFIFLSRKSSTLKTLYRTQGNIWKRTNIFSRGSSCISSVWEIKITANCTLNYILDGIDINVGNAAFNHSSSIGNGTSQQACLHDMKDTNVPDNEPLQVIVVPHSHNDPGWLKTYKQYFDSLTTHILTNIVKKLIEYPDMTFVWVESCFLDMWWSNQTSAVRENFKILLHSGRLEITSGMWVAPDEATTHYFGLLDQMIEGHYWVRQNLGIVPQSSLNFDQFGYSSTMPYFVKEAGIKNVLIKRINRKVKEILGQYRHMNFHWRQYWRPEGKDDIFGHVDTYEWMSISDSCGPDRHVCRGLDFKHMPDLPVPGSPGAEQPLKSDYMTLSMANNLHEYAERIVEQFRKKNANYKYRVLLLPHGDDFRFDTLQEWDKQYKNMKVFMQYVNSNKKEFNVHMRFGTLKDFFMEVDKQSSKYNLQYPVFSGDFYSYTENTEYWTGYFTTRQFDKRLSRELLESLRVAELFSYLLFSDSRSETVSKDAVTNIISNLVSSRKELGIFQHHDAITGTSRAHVAKDYEEKLSSAFTKLQTSIALVIKFLLQLNDDNAINSSVFPTLTRPRYDALTERVAIYIKRTGSNQTNVIFANSLTQRRLEVVSLILDTSNVVVFDHNDREVNFDVMSSSIGRAEIAFEVELQPVSLLIYSVRIPLASREGKIKEIKSKSNLDTKEDFVCENEYLNITFSPFTGTPLLMCYKALNFCTRAEIDWRYYIGLGGAYTMISNGNERRAYDATPNVRFSQGNHVCRVEAQHNYFSSIISLPLTKGVAGRAMKVTVISDLTKHQNFNGDLAMRINSSVTNGNNFYVDSNGLQLMGRKFRTNIPFDGNLYPMTTMAMIEDDNLRLVVHSAQPHGVVGRASGVLDFMLDRIALKPEMGLPEQVQDNKPTKIMLFIEFQHIKEFERITTKETAITSMNSLFLNDVIQHPVYTFYINGVISQTNSELTFLRKSFPCDIILANIKNLVTDKLTSNGTSITLFRRAVSCSNNNDEELFCPLFDDSSNMHPAYLLGTSYQRKLNVTEMFLSHLAPKRTLQDNSRVTLKSMDMKTFLLN